MIVLAVLDPRSHGKDGNKRRQGGKDDKRFVRYMRQPGPAGLWPLRNKIGGNIMPPFSTAAALADEMFIVPKGYQRRDYAIRPMRAANDAAPFQFPATALPPLPQRSIPKGEGESGLKRDDR